MKVGPACVPIHDALAFAESQALSACQAVHPIKPDIIGCWAKFLRPRHITDLGVKAARAIKHTAHACGKYGRPALWPAFQVLDRKSVV